MTKVLRESDRLRSAPSLTKIGLRGAALLGCVAIPGLLASSACAATDLQPLFKRTPAKESVLYTFTGGIADGASPDAGVIRDSSGNLYGTTYWGRGEGCGGNGCGSVFKIDRSGKETILYSFSGGADGAQPNGELTLDSSGNLYGTTSFGGNSSCTLFGYTGCGVVFELTASGGNWTETVLYAFSGQEDGWFPTDGNLLLDQSGNLYGTAALGGDLHCKEGLAKGDGCGVVFELSPNGGEWEYTVLHRFRGAPKDGLLPLGIAQDSQGNLFGVTLEGGADDAGTVFSVAANGKEKVLYSFTGLADGAYPYGVLTMLGGDLYGTASEGGDLSACGGIGCGVVFEMTEDGTENVLYSFTYGSNGSTDGAYPETGVVMDASGNMFGMTNGGGTENYGTVFELTGSGETVLHNFTDGADGAYPAFGNLVFDPKGNLYGTPSYGGDTSCSQSSQGCGVIFKLKP